MPESKILFLERLADLCEEYDADIFYTNNDDGIHISLGGEDGEEVFVNSDFGNLAEELRKAALDLKDGLDN